MNGAAPVPPRMTRAATRRRTSMIGVSHHFLLCRRKSVNSATIPRAGPAASDSNVLRSRLSGMVIVGFLRFGSCCVAIKLKLAEVRRGILGLRAGEPVGRGGAVEGPMHGVAAQETHDESNRGHYQVIRGG